MKLTEKPDIVQWPVTHFIFVEKVGPIQDTARQAWEALLQQTTEIGKKNVITGRMSLYKIKPEMIYRAGVVVDTKPETLPTGIHYEKFEGGKYSRFILTGSYSLLGPATSKAFEIVKLTNIPIRDDFMIENFVNSPDTTPEENLQTEILIPTK